MNQNLPASILTKSQKKLYGARVYCEHGETYRIKAVVRYDDQCGNGHNTFSVTCNIDRKGKNGQWYDDGGGAAHDEITKHFPELAPFIKWHLCSSDGPMHYPGNALYFAGERDCWGLLKGEVRSYAYALKFNDVPITHEVQKPFFNFLQSRHGKEGAFTIASFVHPREPQTFTPNWTLTGYGSQWHECQFRNERIAQEFCDALNTCRVEFLQVPDSWGEGKARELDSARHAAIWPEATDAELRVPADELRATLEARLPALMQEFKVAMESLGFVY